MRYMKRLWAAVPALLLCLCLAGCGQFVSIMPGTDAAAPGQAAETDTSGAETDAAAESGFEERPLFEFLGWDRLAANYYEDTPIALSMEVTGGAVSYASPVFDRASIIAACDALRAMTVTGQARTASEGESRTVFTLTMDDGTEYAVSFADGTLQTFTGGYAVSGGDALWDIPFPGYDDGFDVFDLYYSDDIRAFADGFYEDGGAPVSVGRRINGGAALASQDPAVVEQVFSLLANAAVDEVEMSPDQNIDLTQVTDYVFTMADARTVTFSFTDRCLAVTASQDYGTVYYWLEGIDELPYLTILPESTLPVFEGGTIDGMREDFRQAADAASGTDGSLTIAGIYVDFTIDGVHGYITLSGEAANSFLTQVMNITADGEAVEEIPEDGDTITVSVTLSDMSGPIVYFMGDTVQQMVGVNYACDGDAMAALRSDILELAEDSENVGLVAGNSTE